MWITPSGERKIPADAYVQMIIGKPDNYRVMERMPLDVDSVPIRFKGTDEPIKHLAIMSYVLITHKQDKPKSQAAVVDSKAEWGYEGERLVELGIVRCGVDMYNHICSVDEIFNEIMDPGCDISAEFTRQTGITDDMAKGIHFDKSRTVHVGSQPEHKGTGLGEDRLGSMVAHILRDVYMEFTLNGEYNPLKRFNYETQKRFPRENNSNLMYPRSILEYDWNRRFATENLEILLEREGFFFDSTSAYMRSLAMALMLHRVPESMHYFHEPKSHGI